MFQVEFFETDSGECDVGGWLDELKSKEKTDKDARVQLDQVARAISRLQMFGTRNPTNIVKHLDDGIWELRPGGNRVLFFHYENGRFILLHHFRKKTLKTPPAQIKQAKEERAAYLRRNGGI